MRRLTSILALLVGGWIGAAASSVEIRARQPQRPSTAPPRHRNPQAVVNRSCVTCHNQRLRTAGLALDTLDAAKPNANAEVWERVIGKLRAQSMPPPGRPRPDAATYRSVATTLERDIDQAWAAHPKPGRIGAVHRLNRTEYTNVIRDLFALDLDVRPLLPGDETADGSFDNLADALSISTAHLERYLSVARQVTRTRDGTAADESARSRRSIFRSTSFRTIDRARICRSDREAASPFRTTSRSMASISSRSACSASIRNI